MPREYSSQESHFSTDCYLFITNKYVSRNSTLYGYQIFEWQKRSCHKDYTTDKIRCLIEINVYISNEIDMRRLAVIISFKCIDRIKTRRHILLCFKEIISSITFSLFFIGWAAREREERKKTYIMILYLDRQRLSLSINIIK